MFFCSLATSIALAVTAVTAFPFSESSIIRRGVYGSVVDTVDATPVATALPATLPNRNANANASFIIGGSWSDPFEGSLGGDYLMFYTGQNVTLTGTGYFQVRWEVGYFNRPGLIVPPVWTGLNGKLFHVASGGGRRMTDKKTSWTGCAGGTWMGCPNRTPSDMDTLPNGMLQMWQNEFYYLEGEVTLHDTESSVDYNLSVTPLAWRDIHDDINGALDAANNIVRYGLVRDTGDDNCPVPQYLTCKVLMDLMVLRNVTQLSDVSNCAVPSSGTSNSLIYATPTSGTSTMASSTALSGIITSKPSPPFVSPTASATIPVATPAFITAADSGEDLVCEL